MKSKKHILLLFLVCFVAVLFMGSVSAATGDKYVNGSVTTSGTGDSWSTAYKTIQEGLDNVANAGTVNIAPGTYTGAGNTNLDVKTSEVTIQGAGQNKTMIDGTSHLGSVLGVESGEKVTIQDLTIQNSVSANGAMPNYGVLTAKNVTFKNNTAYANGGGAIYNEGTLTVENSKFTSNIVTTNGGAIYNYGSGTCTVTSSIFLNNSADQSGGAITNKNAYLTVKNSKFTNNNAAWYGAICNSDGSMTIGNSNFTGNNAIYFGGAVGNSYDATIRQCEFSGNIAQRGGAIHNFGTMTVTGCNFNNNNATLEGGAIYNDRHIITVKYSRLVGNTAANTPQDIYMNSGTLNAKLNWWGSNAGPSTGRIAQNEGTPNPEIYSPWLVMNIKSNPSTIYTGQTSKITANVYMDSANDNHSADANQFFSGPQVTFTTNLGKIGSDSITVPWVLGQAVRPLVANEGQGLATVTAADGQVVATEVTILQAPTVNAVTNTEGTVGMQETGMPITGLILAVLTLFGGLIVSKR